MKKRWCAVALGLLGLAGCGDDGGGEAASAVGGPARYCEISERLDGASDALISEDADTDAEVAKGFADLFKEYGKDFEDLVEAAPAEIKADVAKGVEAFRLAADGDFSGMEAFDDAKIADYDAQHCQ
ncbi:MAG: hypothetical protein ACRDYV_11460 [Acidimicrobiia bacterium]